MTLKMSFIIGLAVAALVVGGQTASAAPTPDASNGTSVVQSDSGQDFLYLGGYPQSGYGYLGNAPASSSAVGSESEIDWPRLGIGFGVGMVVLLGLILTVRIGRSHPVMH